MTDYTPTTEEIISAYTWAVDGDDAEARAAEARRWLAQHNRKIAAETLREYATDLNLHQSVPDDGWGQYGDDLCGNELCLFWDMTYAEQDRIEALADRIEQGDES